MIRDVNSQVEKAINEIEMRYSKGIKFRLEDLISVSSCINESNFANFRNSLKSKLINKRVAQIYSVRNDGTTYIKL